MDTTLASLGALAPHERVAASRKVGGQRVAEGIAPEEFDEIVRLHQRRIYRLLLALLRDPDAADALTQDCFLQAYRKRSSFRSEASVGTWLARIAVNLARDHGKSRRHAFWRRLIRGAETENPSATVEAQPDWHASPQRELEAREELAMVWSAVDELSPKQRSVFILRFVEEMPLDQIAKTMNLEVGTVKSHLSRAVSAVRQRLKKRGSNARASN